MKIFLMNLQWFNDFVFYLFYHLNNYCLCFFASRVFKNFSLSLWCNIFYVDLVKGHHGVRSCRSLLAIFICSFHVTLLYIHNFIKFLMFKINIAKNLILLFRKFFMFSYTLNSKFFDSSTLRRNPQKTE